MRKRLGLILVTGLVVWGCTTQQAVVREGKEYGVTQGVFHGRWWNYYERGASYLSGDFYAEAESDLRKAIDGRSRDTWAARTYGMHFVEYFPNRELGIVYYKMDRLDEAQQYIEASLGQVDTERGHYYLDLIKRAKIARGKLDDISNPTLTALVTVAELMPPAPAAKPAEPVAPAPVAQPAEPKQPVEAPKPVTATPAKPEKPIVAAAPAAPTQKVIISERQLPIEIKASDDIGVAKVAVNGQELPQRGSAEQVSFSDELVLKEGTHEIEIAASDLADKEVKQTVEVTVDLTGPTIGIFAPSDPTVTENIAVQMEGISVDNNGVVSVALGDRVLAESPGDPRLKFSADLPLGKGENSFVLLAKDTAGNETRSAVKVFRGRPDSMAARLWVIQQKAPHLLAYAANGFPEYLPAIETSLAAADEPAVLVNIKSPSPDRPYRHNRTLRISGDVIAQTKVASLTINGEPFEPMTGAPKESFNKRIPIDMAQGEGDAKKTVTVTATDDQGHESKQEFEVDIRPIEINSRDSKMPVAVLAFAGSDVDASTSELLRTTTEMKLQDTDRFRMLDRTQLQAVLTEQQLAASLADPAQAIQLGKLINAQMFVVAEVFPRDQKGLEIKARAISSETTDLLATLDAFVDDRDDSAKIEAGCKGLAAQLVQDFPRLSGEVLSVRPQPDGADLLVNWTKEDGVVEGMYMLIVKEDLWVDETTGEVLDQDIVEIGRAKIERILTNGSKAKAIKAEEGAELAEGMAAITM